MEDERVTAATRLDLSHIVPLLTNPVEVDYYRRLRDLANLIRDLPSLGPA